MKTKLITGYWFEYETNIELKFKNETIRVRVFQDYGTWKVNDIIYYDSDNIGFTDTISLISISNEFKSKLNEVEPKILKYRNEITDTLFKDLNVLTLSVECNELEAY